MVSQIYLDCVVCLGPENLGNKDGDSIVPLSSEDPAAPQMPVKKVTRQWAAWTRQEEESFFAALRQVGKNFEKITCHVQSKNKDQVRHYYYRLVRRMNKLLGPELCLDAKNSKDTNAAMLRWSKKSCILHFLVEFDLLSWEMTGYGAMEFIVLLTRIQAWEASLGYI